MAQQQKPYVAPVDNTPQVTVTFDGGPWDGKELELTERTASKRYSVAMRADDGEPEVHRYKLADGDIYEYQGVS